MTSFEDELKALRILYSTLQPFTRERRDSMITQVQGALNREGQKVRPLDPRHVTMEKVADMVGEWGVSTYTRQGD